jgi:hypothetical protein
VLPKGVGYSIGKGSAVKWIVMQVHYLKEKPAGDNAGVRLRYVAVQRQQEQPGGCRGGQMIMGCSLLCVCNWGQVPAMG